jgi:hypothetical protein
MRDGHETFREEYRLCRPDGDTRWVMAEGVALREYSGEALGFIRAVADITSHRRLEAELTRAREQLEERVRQRTADLLAEMHEREKLEKARRRARRSGKLSGTKLHHARPATAFTREQHGSDRRRRDSRGRSIESMQARKKVSICSNTEVFFDAPDADPLRK